MQGADPFNGDLDMIARLQPVLLISGIAVHYPLRCSCEDQIAGHERHVMGQIGNDLCH